MTKENFNQFVQEGLDNHCKYMAVAIKTEGNPGLEIIVNTSENFDAKIKYYREAYNDDMVLIRAKESGKLIRMIAVFMLDDLAELGLYFSARV